MHRDARLSVYIGLEKQGLKHGVMLISIFMMGQKIVLHNYGFF